jgi:predicted acylesterase/phospholipase RssA
VGRTRIDSKRKIAFVCSGGATKAGAFHLGVALALQEQGFKFLGGMAPHVGAPPPRQPMEISIYVGSSAGSIISSYLAAGYSLDNIFNSFLGRTPTEEELPFCQPKILQKLTYPKMFKLANKGKLFNQMHQLKKFRHAIFDLLEGNWQSLIEFRWLKLSGIFSTAGIESYMREDVLLSNQFHEYLADLFIVATQLNHSKKIIFSKHRFESPANDCYYQYDNTASISDACAASTALPVIFAPHCIRGLDQQETYYIDGEIRETLSTHVAIDAGADLIIASYTHQPYHVPAGHPSLSEYGLPTIIVQSIYLLIEQKIRSRASLKQSYKNTVDSVSNYCKEQGITDSVRLGICQIIEKELNFRKEVNTIYIHPNPEDSHMFFGEHFTLSPKKMTEIVKTGFRAAIDTLRKYEF